MTPGTGATPGTDVKTTATADSLIIGTTVFF